MKQEFFPYWEWEDYKSGMWRKVDKNQEKEFLKKSIEFTGDHIVYGQHMMIVIYKWPISCRQNLTDINQNRKAWIGHAACQIGINCPEYITRMAWGFLSNEQRLLANKEAEKAIDKWESINIKGKYYAKELFE